MTILELVQATLKKNAGAFANIHESRAEKIVGAVLTELGSQIKSIKEGDIEIGQFGKFVVRQVNVDKDGRKVIRRRVIFRAAATKEIAGKGSENS